MGPFSRIICIVLDGVGVGEAPDAELYGDRGSNSLANTARRVGALRLPNLERMGLGRLVEIEGVRAVDHPIASFGRMKPASPGKDSIAGHWELMSCVLDSPFQTYPDGFPPRIVESFERAVGRAVLGNRVASGTAIIQELGEEHLRTGRPILYTSQDSVFQVAAHESIVPVEELYRWCEKARALLGPEEGIARVIARPFLGGPGGFYRTPRRRDFSMLPPRETVLDALASRGHRVLAIGKVSDLFSGRGVARAIATKNNREGMEKTLAALAEPGWSVVFTNLVDFDTMWGHRNDARAYALGLEEFDSFLNVFLPALDDRDLLVITSDHGNDPTTPSTDHSREWVPLVVFHRGLRHARDLGPRGTLADVGRTVADNFELEREFPGRSFLADVGRV